MADTKTKTDIVDKVKDLRINKFKLESHYTMERFCVVFISFVLVLGLIAASAIHQKIENSKITLTAQAIYGDGDTLFSLTQDVVKIDGLWANKDHTKGIILIHLPGGMANMSTQAKDYQMLMTGVNGKLENQPTGTIYVFGSTGYIGLGFTDSAGFKPAAYKIILRNLSYMNEGDQEAAAKEHEGEESFMHRNQIQIIANFAATGAPIAKFYSKPDYTATDIYNELVQSQLIKEKITECDTIVSDINTSMRKANEYARRLEMAGITMEENLPAEIFGDAITTAKDTSSPVFFDPNYMMSMSSGFLNSTDGFFKCVDTHDDSAYPKGSHLYMTTDYVFPGGLNFEYQNLTPDSSLLEQIIPAGKTYAQFVSDLNDQQNLYTVNTNPSFGNYVDTRTGTVFTKDQQDTDLVGDNSKSDIQNYESEISNIYSKKRDLQLVKLRDLLKLYYDSASMSDMTSVYTNSDALILY